MLTTGGLLPYVYGDKIYGFDPYSVNVMDTLNSTRCRRRQIHGYRHSKSPTSILQTVSVT